MINMNNLEKCVDKYFLGAHLNNVAIRIGQQDNVIAELYRSSERKLDETTLFDMASVTKIMATTALALLPLTKSSFSPPTLWDVILIAPTKKGNDS